MEYLRSQRAVKSIWELLPDTPLVPEIKAFASA